MTCFPWLYLRYSQHGASLCASSSNHYTWCGLVTPQPGSTEMWQLSWGRSRRELQFILSRWASAPKPWPLWYSFQSLKLKQGKPTQGVFHFSLWDDSTFSPAAAADTVQGTVVWMKESVWLREKQAHILIWSICFLLFFIAKKMSFSLLASPVARAEGTPQQHPVRAGCPEFTENGGNRPSTLTKRWAMKNI